MKLHILIQQLMYIFNDIFTNEDKIVLLRINKRFRNLKINDEKYLRDCISENLDLENVAISGDVIKWFYFEKYNICDKISYFIKDKDIETFKFLHLKHVLNINENTYYYLSMNGCINIIKYIYNIYGFPYYKKYVVCNNAAKYNHIEILKWLYHETDFGEDIFKSVSIYDEAVDGGNLEILKWLYYTFNKHHNKRRPITKGLCEIAAQKGNLEILKWCVEYNYGCEHVEDINVNDICVCAALSGNIDMMKYLIEELFGIMDERMTRNAAIMGHKDMLFWLLENGCPYNYSTSIELSNNRHYELLKIFVENGYKCCENALINVAINGNFELLKWLDSKNCELSDECLNVAAINCFYDMVEWLLNKGCKMNNFMLMNMENGIYDEKTIELLNKYGVIN